MYAICIESSHIRGMGHFYRAMNLIEYLMKKNERYIVIINKNEEALELLKKRNVRSEIVNLYDFKSDWESNLIDKYNVDIWIDDRMETNALHARNVKKNGIKLITFDDRGEGAKQSDINICAMAYENLKDLKGKIVLTGTKYLILNKRIDTFKGLKMEIKKVIVTLGGSDTYGVSVKVMEIIKNLYKDITVITGPTFKHFIELDRIIQNSTVVIKGAVPCLIEEIAKYDLAITGGGITPFEANALGVPCIIVANELHETQSAKYLESIGSSIFAGYHECMDEKAFEKELDIRTMSQLGMDIINTQGTENIFNEIENV